MVLLPDIEFIIDGERCLLSIQEPFTLNGYLVTDIDMLAWEMSYQSVPSGTIRIKNENNYYVELELEEFKYRFEREIDHFINRHGFHACVVDRPDISDWSSYSFEKYLYEIQRQRNKIRDYQYNRYSNSYYLNALKADLRRQGRENIDSNARYSFTFNNYGLNVDEAVSAFHTVSSQLSSWCNSNNRRATTEVDAKKYIHNYNYKPEYIHHYMADEDKDTTLILGAEIEVDCGGKSEEHAKNVLNIMCGYDLNSEPQEDKIYCMGDGSLIAGLEFTTMPCSLEYHKKEMRYKEMFKYLDDNGYKAHDTTTCGLHIHADRKYLGKSELVQQLTISKILYILEKFNDEICIIARRNNSYSKFVGAGKDEKSVIELYGKYKNNTSKYVALNLKHDASIEFRCFKGTLKYETFILTLEFVKDIIDFAKSINIEEIETMKWSDLMNTFSDELKEYYSDRLEKENKEKTEKEKKADNTSLNVMNWSTGTIRTISASGLRANTIVYDVPISVDEYGERLYNTATQRTLEYFAEEWNRQTNGCNLNKTTEENLKDKIKSLKKKIKNSNNFMEKKNLEKELNEAQKELKKEKKKNKLNNHSSSASAFVCAYN